MGRVGLREVAVDCPRCQHENPPGSNFCLGCGARLELTCASCGTDLTAGSRFCNKCGTPVKAQAADPRFTSPDSYTPKHLAERILTSKAALEGERKQVTVLFADLKGSMELLADRDPGRGQAPGSAGAPPYRGVNVPEMGMTYWLEKVEREMRELG